MTQPITIPELRPATTGRPPRVHRRTLPTGLEVIAVRRPSVPMVEARLRIPVAMAGGPALAKATVLAETMLEGTANHDGFTFEQAIGLVGGQLAAAADRDKMMVGGSALAARLGDYLELMAEAVITASYPKQPVEDERDRLVEHLVIAESSAGTSAAKAIAAKLYGAHPYATAIPETTDIAAVSPAQVRSLHRSRVQPEGAVLVLVGDLQPAKALDLAESAFAEWSGSPSQQRIPAVSFAPSPAITVVDRPGSVQSAIRVALPAIGRDDPAYPVQQVANVLFGGYFSSRLVRNLREDKGYTYSPRSSIDVGRASSALMISADVATEVTAASVNEIRYELGRLASTPVGDDELADAREYLTGSSLITLSSQSGLASNCANLEVAGYSLDWLTRNLKAITAVTADAVRRHAQQHITSPAARVVVVGDASRIVDELGCLGEVELAQ